MHRAKRKRRGEEPTGASAALPSKSRKQATKRAPADDHIRRADAIITSFTEITTKLSGAIASCVNKVAELLHAKELIGFKLKDDTINGTGTDADKSGKLVVQLERTLRDEDNPAEFMEKLCSVLKDPSLGERKLVQIADSLLSVLSSLQTSGSDDEIDGDDAEQQETTKRKRSGKVSTKGLGKQQGSKRKKPDQTKAPSNTKRRKTDSDVSDEEEHDSDVESGSSDYDTADDDGPDDPKGSERNVQKRNGSKAYSLNPFNKMAAKVDGQSSSGPADIFRRTLSNLSTPIGEEPSFTAVTDLLFSKDLITQNVLDGITSQPNLTDKQRGSKVAHKLLDKIKASDDPIQCLLEICDVLEDEEVNDELLKKYGASMRSQLLSATTAQQVPAVVNAHVPSLTATVVPHPSSAAAPLQVTPSPSTDTFPSISAGKHVEAPASRVKADDKLKGQTLGISNLGEVMDKISDIAIHYQMLGQYFHIPPPKIREIAYVHRNDDTAWHALNATASEWLRWNFDRTTEDGDKPNRRWLVDAVGKLDTELADKIEKEYSKN